MLALNTVHSVYYSEQSEQYCHYFTHPIVTSLQRAKQKLLYNVHYQKMDWNTQFVSLTVSDEAYEEVFIKESGSATLRKFMTNLRNWVKRGCSYRPKGQLGYFWRIERGTQSTQRLHFHLIIRSTLSNELIKDYILSRWDYTDWKKLEGTSFSIEKSFQELSDSNLASLYACKYTIKSYNQNKKNKFQEINYQANKTKNELKTRLWTTSREYVNKPSCGYMRFNPINKAWKFAIKKNWSESLHQESWFRIGRDINNWAYSQFDGRWYSQKFRYLKLQITNFKKYTNKDDLLADIQHSSPYLKDFEQCQNFMEQFNKNWEFYASHFGYEIKKSKKSQLFLKRTKRPCRRSLNLFDKMPPISKKHVDRTLNQKIFRERHKQNAKFWSYMDWWYTFSKRMLIDWCGYPTTL